MYVQQNISYFIGNLIPGCFLYIAILMLLAGKPNYALRPPNDKELVTTLSIVKEAIKRWRRPSLSSSFVHHWLDRAKKRFGGSYTSWEVEDVKKVLRLLPIFATFVLYGTIYAQVSL